MLFLADAARVVCDVDCPGGGRQLKLLVAIDDYTRECLVIEVGHFFTAQDVIGILRYLFAVRGAPNTREVTMALSP